MTSMGLINRAIESDPTAWERMVYLYTPLIEYWAFQRGASDIENIRQEVLTRLYKALGHFEKRQNGSFRGWLHTITNNLINKTFGKQQPIARGGDYYDWLNNQVSGDKAMNLMFDSVTESDNIENSILYRRIMDWVRTNYSEEKTNIFVSVVVHQRKPSDVASELGISPNVVYQTKSRILADIRREFHNLV